ncbi:NAD(P)-dependent oxidoreductase [Winogradskyella echinorum]|uniref:NAD(P)-dependent oxidoreductase n=1 Tax=Winogradskyella echinorum TaxID=538189 RepID=A0ABR6Y3J1_9FLAO|nr:NAD(P)-dependent oxidoreductase [Winogradskyella echinorum]MBC3846815.1 NAD(P)-dependent oxidoreductase [Winogradskyella echinorum]MBC5751163.1 NAD(P)-dependent oxidoreductase [Winogradskyella echinorum]
MTEILKKYLVIKWWLPILVFGISIILFISGAILPNTDFAFYTVLFFGVVLLISTIWQFLKGKIAIGFLQLSILAIPILFFGFMVYLFSGMMNKPDGELALDRIEHLIQEKTDLTIPKDFEILENLIEHTEGALDSDYFIGLTIQYNEYDEKNIVEQILKSAELKSDKGSWKKYDNGFDFEHNKNEINRAEPFYFKVDTLNNKMELNLSHL